MGTSAFHLSSYNIRGLSVNNIQVVNDIIEKFGEDKLIMGIQEHFQVRKNLRKISNSFSNMAVIARGAYKSPTIVNNGRPKGGNAILVPKSIRSSVGIVECRSWRIQAITIVIGTKKFLIFNLYLPCDLRRAMDKCDELLETLAEVGEVINNTKHDILINLGDMNTDIRRESKHVEYVEDFWAKFNLRSICNDIDYTCGGNVIDHFVVYRHQIDLFSDTEALHPLENSSDHDPIMTKVAVLGWKDDIAADEDGEKVAPKTKFEWKKANEEK